MEALASQLRSLVDDYRPKLQNIDAEAASVRPAPGKWSKKEILGHLIDSAQNNLRRFIVAQYETLPKIVYQQDEWVRLNCYAEEQLEELVQLWYLLNRQIARIWANMDEAKKENLCMTSVAHSIEWLAEDYVKHLKHHIHQVLDLTPVAYP